MSALDNPNPVIFSSKKELKQENAGLWLDSAFEDDDGLDSTTLEQLGVVSADQIKVTGDHVDIQFTPTVPHCGMATLIGMPA